MRTADDTYLALSEEGKLNTFYKGLKAYVKSKLTLIEVKGSYSNYTCGPDYHHSYSDPDWKPFKQFEHYCEKKGFDFFEAKDMVEKHIGKKIICECQLVNDEKANRRARLQKAFGLDFGPPGRETCDLYEDD